MEPLFLTYVAIPLGYAGVVVGLSSWGTIMLDRGRVDAAIRLFKIGARAPLLGTQNLISKSNLMAAYHAVEDYVAVEQQWLELEPQLKKLAPYSGLPAASYCASLVCQGRYREAVAAVARPEAVLSDDQRGNRTAMICESLRQANQAACHLLLGQLEEADVLLTSAEQAPGDLPMLNFHLTMMRARWLYQSGQVEAARQRVQSTDPGALAPLYKEEMCLHRGILLARCGQIEEAEHSIRLASECLNTRRVRMLRMSARAGLAEARGEDALALSYYCDVIASGLPVGEAALRAGNLARRVGDTEQARHFYAAAETLDPESCWATFAAGRLETLSR